MKKMMMMAFMAAATMTTFAQKEVIKNAESLLKKGNVEEAIQAIQPALNAGTNAEKAAAWNLLSSAHYKKFSDIQTKKLEAQVKQTGETVDEAAMYAAIVAAFEAALKCDEYDNMPDEKGKVKPKFRAANQKIFHFQNGRLQCIYAGQYEANENKDNAAAFKAFALYVDTQNAPLFTGIDMTKDNYVSQSQVSYYAGLAAYQGKDYPNAIKYAQIAAQDTAQAKGAVEIVVYAKKETMQTKQDTLEYINTLKEVSQQFPDDSRYSGWLGDYYLNSGNNEELIKWADTEIAKNPQNKMAYTFKGEAFRLTDKFDEAVECYKKAFEIDPTYVVPAFQAGVALYSKAVAMKDELADKKTGMLTNENADKVKVVLADAKDYLEKVREGDPNREQVNWAYALYQVYYSLKDEEKAAELEKILENN